MASSATMTTFAEQKAFAAKLAKEKAAVEWAVQQSTEEQQEQQRPRRRVRQRRTTRDGQDIFAVTFFDGNKPKRTDWLAEDARRNAEFGVEQHPKGTLGYRLRQLKSKGLSKSRSEPRLGTKKRERRNQDEGSTNPNPFRTLFPLPAKGVDMRKETARDQADLFKPRPETVALSATEKYKMRMWGLDVDAVTWSDGTKPPPWVKASKGDLPTAVGNTTNKWANKELGIRAAREEQEFVEKLREMPPSRNKQPSEPFSFSSSPETTLLPPWVKELPPVRDGRRQFATGDIIPFLDQHAYPEGGVAEVKRARRREKQAFLKAVLTAKNAAPSHRAALRQNAPDAAAGITNTSKKRPPRADRRDKEVGLGGDDGVGDGAAGREPPGRAWPYGPVCMVASTSGGRESGGRRRSGESGGGSLTGQAKCSGADGGAAAGAVGAVVCDHGRQGSFKEDGTVTLETDAADSGAEAAGAGKRSQIDETGILVETRDMEHPDEGAARKRGSGCAGKQGDSHADGLQRPRPEVLGQGNENGSTATDQERGVPVAATPPSPVVTSSVRVLDMGVIRPSEE
eukprot:g9953.t1